tara:strand:+ start:119 stop:778 length:660 start_codon:yes stop_codon:yes gene_type:complete
VRAHVALKVEVGKGLALANLEEAGKLAIGVNLATVLLILKTVLTDILVDIASHISAGHLSARGLGKEGSKLVADAGRLHEATGGTSAGLTLALGVSLLGNSKGASPLLLESTILGLKGSKKSTHLLKLGKELTRLGDETTVNLRDSGGSSSLLHGRLGRSRSGGRSSLGLSGLLSRGLGCLLGRSLGLGLSRLGLYHFIMYTDIYFLSGLTQNNIYYKI